MSGPDDDRRALGAVLARLRTSAGLTQEAVAHRCVVSRTYISHAEAGRQLPGRKFWEVADEAVRADGALVAAYDAYTGTRQQSRTLGAGMSAIRSVLPVVDLNSMLDTDLKAWLDMNRREMLEFLAVAGTLPAAALLAGLERGTGGHVARGLPVKLDAAAIDQIETVLDAVGRQYEAFGPKAVLAVRQGQADLVDALLPDCPSPLRPRLLSVRASLARSLGWQSYDAGDLRMAGHHYELARNAAHEAANPSLTALVLCNMSLAATRGGRPGVGVDHAMAAAYWADRSDDRYLLAYARDMAAEAHAELRQAHECRTALDEAREIIERAAYTHLPTYVYDPALNAGFAAECLIKLGVGNHAVTAANRCVELIDPAFALSRGFADVGLGTALCLIGEADEAARIIARTADTALTHGSARLTSEVRAARDTISHTAPGSASLRELDTKLTAHGLA
ncbi:helix-turn-helix domain-containing protein [Nocardia amamiensis]|uniref:helix-turn-helix domain-containing protein n=1 Tax=Nocardia amamiensis TaxID=404578 RepID=UPI00082FA285|nr:helix-turn-helix domain-containing protein [Nocardia amamiensis]